MTNYMLYRLTKRSNAIMANMLRKHIEFTPDQQTLEGMEVDDVVENIPRQTDTCKVGTDPKALNLLDVGETLALLSYILCLPEV